MNLRTKGKEGEEIAKQHYLNQGYTLIKANYAIRGGEIDILMKKGKMLIAIEVKNLDTTEELDDYISPKKIGHLQRTLNHFLQGIDESAFDEIRIDAVFVQQGKIIEIYQDITNT